jgi:hypothetical protein
MAFLMVVAINRQNREVGEPAAGSARAAIRRFGFALAIAVLSCATSARAAEFKVALDDSEDTDASAASGSDERSEDATEDTGSKSGSSWQETHDSNPAHYEFAFISMGAYQTWGLAGRWLYFGAGGGIGPPLYRYAKLGDRDAGWDPSLDIVYGNAFLRIQPIVNLDLDFGPKIAIISSMYDVTAAPQAGFSYGGYVDLRIGSRTIKLGPRFEYDRVAYFDTYDKGWRLTPLMLRVVH